MKFPRGLWLLAAGWQACRCLPPWVLSNREPNPDIFIQDLLWAWPEQKQFSVKIGWHSPLFCPVGMEADGQRAPSPAPCSRPCFCPAPTPPHMQPVRALTTKLALSDLAFIGSSWMLEMEPDVRLGDHLKGQVISSICLCRLISTGGHAEP